MNNFYVYTWTRPDTGTVFYVGKGQNGRDVQLKYHNSLFLRIVNKIERLGLTPSVERVRENLTEDEAFEVERDLIVKYGRINIGTGTLANLTDGGEGTVGRRATEEQRLLVAHSKHILPPQDGVLYKGVHKSRNKWIATIGPERRYLGTFFTPEDAARVYDKAAFAVSEKSFLNFPDLIHTPAPEPIDGKSEMVVSKLELPPRNGGFKGVRSKGKRWEARVTLAGKTRSLGSFPDPEAAALAYDAVVSKLSPRVYLNFPDRIAA